MSNITMTTKTYSRTASGKSWKSKPDSTKKESLTDEGYNNMTSADTQKFFRRLGGSEVATKSYTRRGYVVTSLSSTSPDREIKKVREFSF